MEVTHGKLFPTSLARYLWISSARARGGGTNLILHCYEYSLPN